MFKIPQSKFLFLFKNRPRSMKRSIDIYNNVTKSQSIIDVYDPSVKRPPDERSAVLAFFFGATSNGNKKSKQEK